MYYLYFLVFAYDLDYNEKGDKMGKGSRAKREQRRAIMIVCGVLLVITIIIGSMAKTAVGNKKAEQAKAEARQKEAEAKKQKALEGLSESGEEENGTEYKVVLEEIEEESSENEEETEAEEKEIVDPAYIKAKEKMDTMTLEEKVAQLFIITPEALTGYKTVTSAGEATKQALKKYPVAGLIYFEQNLISKERTISMMSGVKAYAEEVCDIPLFLSIDEEGGKVARIANKGGFDTPHFENMSVIGATSDVTKAYEAGEAIGGYLSEYGFNLDFAPVADVLTNPDNTVVKERSFGSDPQIVSEMDTQFLRGLHEHGVIGCLKHFPGHGATLEDTHEGYAYTDRTKAQLMETELIPFIDGIKQECPMIMVGHIAAPSVTGDEIPASLSEKMVQKLLREEMGYDGVVITDALNMGAIVEGYSSADACLQAFNAGVDILLMPSDFQAAYSGICNAVKTGKLEMERVNESILRILKLKYSNM